MIDKNFKNLIVIFVNLIELMSHVSDWRCLKAKKYWHNFMRSCMQCMTRMNVHFFVLLCFSCLEENGYIKVNINGWQR